MAKKSKIDVTPIESMPEWSVASDFKEDESQKKEPVPAAQTSQTSGIASEFVLDVDNPAGQMAASSGLDSGFAMDGQISSPNPSAGVGGAFLSADESASTLGMPGQGQGSDSLLGMPQGQPMGNAMQATMPMGGYVQQAPGMGMGQPMGGYMQQAPGMGMGQPMGNTMQTAMPTGGYMQQAPGMGMGQPMQGNAMQTAMPTGGYMQQAPGMGMGQPMQGAGTADGYMQQTADAAVGQQSQENMEAPGAKPEETPIVNDADTQETPDRPEQEQDEHDVLTERLNHLENAMKDWEQSEHALIEAAAMLSNSSRERAIKEGKPLQQGLDEIVASLSRMSASAKEDMADVIEQTQRDGDLLDAVNIGSFSGEDLRSEELLKEALLKEELLERTPERKEEGQKQPESITIQPQIDAVAAPAQPEPEIAPQPQPEPQHVEMKQLQPLDNEETSGMDVEGLANLLRTPENTGVQPEEAAQVALEFEKVEEAGTAGESAKVSKREAKAAAKREAKAAKAKKSKTGMVSMDDGYETIIMPDDEESPDGFRFIVEKDLVENPTEWKLDASFQHSLDEGRKEMITAMPSFEPSEEGTEIPTVSDIEDQLKKQEIETKRNRAEEGKQQDGAGFAYKLSDLEVQP